MRLNKGVRSATKTSRFVLYAINFILHDSSNKHNLLYINAPYCTDKFNPNKKFDC
jgi:hypothetical protein